jgi:UDP-N-acetylglucosamine--dolichyl-phosphate N-acetylglucosaminephosphotransferase
LFEIDNPLFLATGIVAMAGIAIIGIIDDRYGMRQRMKAILPFLIAIPFGLTADFTTISIPFIGPVDFGYLMILIIPIGITAAANTANMLEGFNGLGCGLGIIMSTTLIIVAISLGAAVSVIILVPLLSSLIALYLFNRYPAKIFPGDTLLLFMGATLAVSAILGGMKEIGFILFIPMIIEFSLKLRRSFTTESFGKLDKFGYLRYYGSVTSLTHIVLKLRRFKEWQVSTIFWGIEFIIAATVLGLLLFSP